MNYNLTPKTAALQDTDFAKRHHAIVENPDFERSIQVALAEYHNQLSRDPGNDPAAAYWRGQGAEVFVRVLRNLAERPDLTKTVEDINLGQNRRI